MYDAELPWSEKLSERTNGSVYIEPNEMVFHGL